VTGPLRLALVGVLTVFACLLAAGCADEQAALLDRHGWTERTWLSQERVFTGLIDDARWEEYLAASRAIGLDFEPVWGRDGHLVTYRLGPPDTTAQILLVEGTIVGAWLVSDGVALPLSTEAIERPAPT
jgi:hypothetical protein